MSDVSGYPPTSSERYDRTLYKTSDTPDSKIKYNASLAAGLRFYVLPGFAHHPVGTVSWFGAAKFCNWLTLDAGMDPAERCYHEGPSKADWYPVVAENWATQGMTADERRAWVNDYRGFRLPMDGVNVDHAGPGNASSWGMTANPFNEWYKAAAFDPAAPDFERPGPADGEIVPADHWTYGFGADEITAADANRGDTGFPGWETTPVGWYNGVNELADTTPTADTRNRYGLYDMSGNVAEWVNDMSLVAPWDANYRAVRGGHFANADPKYLSNSTRQIYSARYYAENKLGFRVARAFGYGDFDADGSVGPADYEFFAAALTGPATEVLPGSGHEAADADGDGHVDLRDFAALQARYPR
jgi:formylglycine-generating enzyme required for sulfatase activity